MPPHNQQEHEVDISNLAPTPFISATLVNEILKGLLFQKNQLPYPYNWLKTVVEKRRKIEKSESSTSKRLNVTYENHFRMVSKAFDTLNSIMKGINKEFCESGNAVREIIILLGATPHCPKEVFTLVMPTTLTGHSERNHIAQLNKHLQKVLRNIFLSQTWMDSIDGSSVCTNTYFYLKRSKIENGFINEEFENCDPVQFPANIKHSVFVLNCKPIERTNCCDTLVFNECVNERDDVQHTASLEEKPSGITWCRSKNFFKGFKDCFVNKVSVCELW